MTVLRRLDSVLEETKQEVLDTKEMLDKAGVVEQDAALRAAAGQAFYNTSKFTLRDLRARANRQQLTADFTAYLGRLFRQCPGHPLRTSSFAIRSQSFPRPMPLAH